MPTGSVARLRRVTATAAGSPALPPGASPLPATEVRATQLVVLQEFSEVCAELGLRWWLCAGTLLGAVRHQGFIPWDDDVDVAMPRPDFEAFCRDPRATRPGRALASLRTDPAYSFPYAKLYDDGTRVVEHYRPQPVYGVGIDIFPVDTWPRATASRRALGLALVLLRGMLGVRIVEPDTLPSPARRLVARVGRPLLSVVPPRWFAATLTRLVVAAGARGTDRGVIVWGYEEQVSAAAFADDVTLEFEGVARPVPQGWDEWLTAAYGDYRTPPPEGARGGHPHLTAYRV